jgi:hypothetical protein
LPLFVGDTLQVRIYLCTPLQVVLPSQWNYQIIGTAGLALQAFVTNGLDSAAAGYLVYTQQITWQTDVNNQYFFANLALNTAALNTLLGNATSAPATLVIGYIQGGVDTTVLYQAVTFKPGLPNASLVLPPGLTALSTQAAAQEYVPINGGTPGQGFFLLTPTGKKLYLQASDDGNGGVTFQASPM